MYEKLKTAFAAFGLFQTVCIIVVAVASAVSPEYNVCMLSWCIH